MHAALTSLRHDALSAFERAVAAVRPDRILPDALEEIVTELKCPGRLIVLALGKAAPAMAAVWRTHRPVEADRLVVVTPHGTPLPEELDGGTEILRGGHPLPDASSLRSARRVASLAGDLGPEDHLLVLLSGGASALLALPVDGLGLDDIRLVTKAILQSGAPIDRLNTVRRALLELAGGGLARRAHPAGVTTLVLSDVPGGALTDIGSGPTVPSPTNSSDALAVLEQFDLLDRIPGATVETLEEKRRHPEAGEHSINPGTTLVIGSNHIAVEAASSFLRDRGYSVRIDGTTLTGPASDAGRRLAREARGIGVERPEAIVFGGETTVVVRGDGVGGRNTELCLAAAIELDGAGAPRAVLSAGTDGIDGLSDCAGAVVDIFTVARICEAGIDPDEALRNNDSATALEAADDTIRTGPTGTNVADIAIVLGTPPPPRGTA